MTVEPWPFSYFGCFLARAMGANQEMSSIAERMQEAKENAAKPLIQSAVELLGETEEFKSKPYHQTILDEAATVTEGDRNTFYGDPSVNHECTALMWSAYLSRLHTEEVVVKARDVCMMNILQKVSRDANMPKRDNLVDIAGYARNAEMIYSAEMIDDE